MIGIEDTKELHARIGEVGFHVCASERGGFFGYGVRGLLGPVLEVQRLNW